MRVSLLLVASISALTLSSVARAQSGEGETEGTVTRSRPAPTEEIVVPSSSTGGKTTVIVVTEEPAKPKEPPPKLAEKAPPEDDDGAGRFRGGVSGTIGAFIPGPVIQFGAEGRLGYQINDLYAVYGDFGAHAGLGAGVDYSSSGATTSIAFGAAVFVSALFEVTLADIWFIGAGPSLMYGVFGTADTSIGTTSLEEEASVFAGGLPGIKVRTGVGFGSDRPNRRKQFTLAVQANIVFGQRYRYSGSTGLLDESESVGIGVGVLPMLALGYDAK